MKYIYFFAFLMYSCGIFAQQNNNEKEDIKIEKTEEGVAEVKLPFEFSKATSQKFNGGAPGSGSTIMLSIFLKKLINENLEFNKIWLTNDKPYYKLKLKRKHMADNWSNYKTDDELILFASSRNNKSKPTAEKTASDKLPPKEFAGDALIEYTFNGELMYYEVPTLEQLQDINAQ